MRKFVSIGGWCGPALILGKLGLRTESYPFDFSRVTIDGIVHFTEHGFKDGFFPEGGKPYRPQCVGPWILYRSKYCAFAHFDLNDSNIQEAFDRKIQRWKELLSGRHPVTFVRTVSARNPALEFPYILHWSKILKKTYPLLDFKVVVIVHDQKFSATSKLGYLAANISLWTLEYNIPEDSSEDLSLFDKAQKGYEKIILASINEHWTSTTTVDTGSIPWKHHNNIALIAGTASVSGTCAGIVYPYSSSSTNESEISCHWCSATDAHKAPKSKPLTSFTPEQDSVVLMAIHNMHQGTDKVEAIEDAASLLNLNATDIVMRMQILAQNTKHLIALLHVEP